MITITIKLNHTRDGFDLEYKGKGNNDACQHEIFIAEQYQWFSQAIMDHIDYLLNLADLETNESTPWQGRDVTIGPDGFGTPVDIEDSNFGFLAIGGILLSRGISISEDQYNKLPPEIPVKIFEWWFNKDEGSDLPEDIAKEIENVTKGE